MAQAMIVTVSTVSRRHGSHQNRENRPFSQSQLLSRLLSILRRTMRRTPITVHTLALRRTNKARGNRLVTFGSRHPRNHTNVPISVSTSVMRWETRRALLQMSNKVKPGGQQEKLSGDLLYDPHRTAARRRRANSPSMTRKGLFHFPFPLWTSYRFARRAS